MCFAVQYSRIELSSDWEQVYSITDEIPGSILGADIDVRGGERVLRFADQLAAFAERMWTGKSERNKLYATGKTPSGRAKP